MTRTLQTATNIFKESDKKLVAVEELQEFPQGVHYCNKRKTKTELSELFPHVDFSLIQENSKYWEDTVFESLDNVKARIQKFKNFAKQRHEKNICVVSHSSYMKQFLYDDMGDVNRGLLHCYPYEYKL